MGVKVKFDRRIWELTEKDLFLDNGACIQLLTQKYAGEWGTMYSPKLTVALSEKWKKHNILYTTPELEKAVIEKYIKVHGAGAAKFKYYKVDIQKLKELGIGVIEE